MTERSVRNWRLLAIVTTTGAEVWILRKKRGNHG